MAEKSEIVKDRGKILNNVATSGKGFDKEENTFEISGKNVDLNGSRNVDDSPAINEDASLTLSLSLGNGFVLGDLDDILVKKASEKENDTDHIDDEDSECDTTLENKCEDTDHYVDIVGRAEDDKCIKISDELTNASDSKLIDPLTVASNKNDRTTDMAEDTKKDGPTLTETPPVKFARIIFDATDMDKGCKTMRLKADTPMREIKKLFPKHLSATEDTFMLYFNSQEVKNEMPLQLFGDNLEGDNNVIKIVKSIKISLEGQTFLQERLKGRHLDVRPRAPFFCVRQKIAAVLKEPRALISLVFNDQEIVDGQTPESSTMGHGDVLKVTKKDEMKIRLKGPIYDIFKQPQAVDKKHYIDISPNTTMSGIKAIISLQVKEDPRKIQLIYKGRQPRDHATPLNLGMSYIDSLFVNLKIGVIIKIKGPVGEIEEFYPAEMPLKWLFQTYDDQMVNSAGKRVKSFVFRFRGSLVGAETTAKNLNMVDGDCITVCEILTTVFRGSVLRKKFELLDIDTQRKFKDVRKYFSDQIGVDVKGLVFSIGENRVVRDDDTLESLNISNGGAIISVSVQQHIQVNVLYFRLGRESQTFTSKMGLGMAMEEWKSEISSKLGEPLQYLSFTWEDSDIADLDTPEQIGIQNGDTIKVLSSSVIKINIERDGEVLADYLIHVDKDFFDLTMWYSREFHVCLNSFGFKLGERDVNIISDTANKIGLMKDGTIKVFHAREKNMMTVEFYVENSSLFPIFPRLKEFPLLCDVSTVEQVILLKCLILELFLKRIEGIEELFEDINDPFWIIFLHNAKEMNDVETFQENGVSKGDKICIDVRERKPDEKDAIVFVQRNMKETKSSMANGERLGDEETCAFKLDSSKPLSEFIKKVKSRITCNSKKDKLFLSFNDEMVDKDGYSRNLKLFPLNNNYFKCCAFPNLEAFKKHLESCQGENMRDDSFLNQNLDFPTWMPNYKRSNENSSEFPATPPDEKKEDIEKKIKALQMRINIDKKKIEKNGSISLAKDIQNHKEFENVDDILKFIGEEDLTSKTSKESKNQVETSKRSKCKNKKKIKTPIANKESDKFKMSEFKRDDFVIEVSSGQDDVTDNKQNESLHLLYKDKQDSRKKYYKNGYNETDLDGDGCKNFENSNDLDDLKDIVDFFEEDSPSKNTEGNKVEVGSFEMKKQNKKHRKETKSKESDKNFMDDEHSEMKNLRKKGKMQKRNSESNKSNNKTSACSFLCNICTFINHRDAIFCDVCGNDLGNDEQNWQKVGIENKRKLANKTYSKQKSNIVKSKANTVSDPEKFLQKSEPKATPFSIQEKLFQESNIKTKETYIEEHVSESIHPKRQVSTFRREDQKQSKGPGDADHPKPEQVKAKAEMFLESEKAIEFPKIEETCFTNKFTSKGNHSRTEVNNTNTWRASQVYDNRRSVTEIAEENKNNEPEDQNIPVLTENEEETRKWCQLMVAARKRRDEERKRDYLKFRDLECRSLRPQLDESHRGSDAQMFCDEVPSGTKPVVPQPMGTVKYYEVDTQGASIPRPMGTVKYYEVDTQASSIPREGRPFGPSFEVNKRPNPNPVFLPRRL